MSVFEKILPIPRKITCCGGTFSLPEAPEVFANFDASGDYHYLLGLMHAAPAATKEAGSGHMLRLAIGEDSFDVLPVPTHKEGYTLDLKETGAQLCAITKEGLAYGLKTLLKLLALGEEIPCARITDEPALSARWVHMCIFNPDDGTEKDDTSFEAVKKRIHAAAMAGYNAVFLEFWGMFPNPRRPYASWPKAYTMEQVKALVSLIRDDLYMDAYPCQNLSSHAGWSRIISRQHVVLDQRPDLQDMWIPGGWCFATENPDTKAYLQDIMEELILAFRQPKFFHISSDKAFGFGSTEADRTRPADVLFVSHITWLNSFLQERGITPIMWNDMIYSCTDSLFWKMDPSMADQLPRNILMNVWTHNDPGEYWPDPLFFEEKGFRTVYSPFMHEGSIRNMIAISKRNKTFGLVQTTWHRPASALPYVLFSGALQWGDTEPEKPVIEEALAIWHR